VSASTETGVPVMYALTSVSTPRSIRRPGRRRKGGPGGGNVATAHSRMIPPSPSAEALDGVSSSPTTRAARLALALLAALACAGEPPCGRDGRCDLVIVSIDTLRADHVGVYGYPRDTTPHLDALARHATLHTRALATSPWTLPSHASLFTGLQPFEHGAHGFLVERRRNNARPLSADALTLAEVLRDAGWETAAFVANTGFMARWTGLGQGFDVYAVADLTGEALVGRARGWLERPRDAPVFLFVNLMDAHRPYNTRPLASGRLPPAAPDPTLLDRLGETVLAGDAAPPGLVEDVVSQYDTGVAHADAALGALLAHLEDTGRLDATVVVVTSDHGEYFGEHGLVEHSKDVYQEALWIPLVVKRAGQRDGRRDATPVSLAHVPALLADALGPAARDALTRAFPRAPGSAPLAENHYARTKTLLHPVWGERFRRVRRVAWDWPWKYVHSSDGRHELYHLERDPAESHNHIDAEPAVAARLARRLAEARERAEPGAGEPAPTLTSEERRSLRELGYVD